MTTEIAASSKLMARAEAVAALAKEYGAEAERSGQLAPVVVDALRDAGIFSMVVPAQIGGGQADLATMLGVIETISKGDGAAGWCAMIAATTATAAATLPREGAEEIFGDPRLASGGVVNPPGHARRVEGGYVVTGKWGFGSGSSHSSWMLGGCIVHGAEGPEMVAENIPNFRLMFFPRDEITVLDTWHVSGLRGTGSNDWEVRDLFVPERRSAALRGHSPWVTGTLYQFPMFGLLAVAVAAVALGIGRAAIEELREVAITKTPGGSRRTLAERAAAQSGIAEAEALVRSSRAFLMETIQDIWARLEGGARLSIDDRTLMRLSATTATMNCARAVDICYNLGGATSIYEKSVLQRQFRDIHTLTQHVMVGQPTLEVAGRIFLGQATDTTMF
jgi:indole-3-acetate monooxygenase